MKKENIELIEKIRKDKLKRGLLSYLKQKGGLYSYGEGRGKETRNEFTEKLGSSSEEVEKVIDFLGKMGLLERSNESYKLSDKGSKILKYATENWNPANPGTNRSRVFEILSDCEWHCSDCELPGSQVAKDIQQIRAKGFEFEGSPSMWAEYRHCETCDRKTVHRKMKHPFPTKKPIHRKELPSSFKKRVRELYDGRDAFDGSTPSTTVEVDHRKPEVRWEESEEIDFENISDEEIKERFQVLSRKNNLLKSRKCEKCVETGKRPPFFRVRFYYEGGEEYNEEVGCEGCGWYNPQKWRKNLNELLEKVNFKEME